MGDFCRPSLRQLIKDSNIPILGSDYPPLSNTNAVLNSFKIYNNLNIIPSVVNAVDPYQTLFSGPFMYTAVSENPVAIGDLYFPNYISGGIVESAILIGGNKGDYFIGGPGKNSIHGGSGNDTIIPHKEKILSLTVNSMSVNYPPPLLSILINGTEITRVRQLIPVFATFAPSPSI